MSTMLLKRRRNEISESNDDYQYEYNHNSTAPRSGKWTPDEERYADKLIQEFDLGLLNDCEEGSTLRSYLARKLNCAPMRISKKYAGKCIGKHVFSSRIGSDRMMYFYGQVHPFVKQARCDDGFVYNNASGAFEYPRGLPSFRYETASPVPVPLPVEGPASTVTTFTYSSPIISPSHSLPAAYPENSDAFSCSSSEFDLLSRSGRNDSKEAEEWRDALFYFCGDFLEDVHHAQPQQQLLQSSQSPETQYPGEFPEQMI